jgi:adenylate cyclase
VKWQSGDTAATDRVPVRYLVASLAASGRVMEASFSARQCAAGHAFKDADKRRLFGEHLVLAGLPE